MKLIVERVRRVCLSGGIRGIRGYSITGNTQSLHLCIGSSRLPTSTTPTLNGFGKGLQSFWQRSFKDLLLKEGAAICKVSFDFLSLLA